MKFLMLMILLSWRFLSAAIVVNEFLASNDSGLQDPQEPGEFPDWVELYNSGEQGVALGGLYLTDNPARPTKWRIPDGMQIAAKGFLLFIADGEPEQGARHTNFKLNRSAGFIGLIAADGVTVIDSLTYGQQYGDISFGRSPDGGDKRLYFEPPTPGAANGVNGFLGKIGQVLFSTERGFYNLPFDLILSADHPDAKIFYTLDGSEPGGRVGGGTMRFTKPIPITTTTHVRAHALLEGWRSPSSVTHTYLFLNDVIRQPAAPAGFPQNWGWTGTGDYEMDPRVVNHPDYKNTIIDDMKSIPTLSLVMDVDDWFGEDGRGIYIQGELDERAVSAELVLPDGSAGFQVNCAVMIVGGTSPNRWKMDKLSMRLKFKSEYGAAQLDYPFFGEDATDEFQTLVLDARMNNSWAYGGGVGIDGRDLRQNDIAQYTRDNFVAELQREAGGLAPHGRQVHLYLNGLYWGLYWVHERPDEHFAAAYRGGNSDDYDVVKHNPDQVVAGANANYKEMFAVANSNRSVDEKYRMLKQYLDIPDFINYMIINFYVGNVDWAHQNWYATRAKSGAESRWRYHSWDAEHVMEGLNSNCTARNDDGGPTRLHQVLRAHPEYQRLFADQVYRHFFNHGLLTEPRLKAIYTKLLNEIDRAVVGESARWGDSHRNTPYTRNVEWAKERDWLLNTYFPQRGTIVLDQLRSQGLFPQAEAPVFRINGALQHGGRIDKGAQLTMSATGEIYFTTTGVDPLVFGDAGKNQQIIVAQDADKRVLVPTENIGIRWRAEQDYNDADWLICRGTPGGIGYDHDSEYNQFIALNVRDRMYDPNDAKPTSCLIRLPFELTAVRLSAIQTLSLNMRYDDGFFAFLNGTLIASANAPDSPVWNAAALSAREAGSVESFDVSNFINRLKIGKNLLAIQGLNVHSHSSDFLITVELISSDRSRGSISVDARRYAEPITLNESVMVCARALSGSDWSPLHTAVFAVPEALTGLRLTEIHYNPLGDDDAPGSDYEFLELKNVATTTLNLSLSGFTAGVRYAFPAGTQLASGQFAVIAADVEAFQRRYGFAPFGVFEGKLDNAGERLIFINAAGDTVLNTRYNDKAPWPKAADGAGYSLAAAEVHPQGNPADPVYWQASYAVHGSPGHDDKVAATVSTGTSTRPMRYALDQNFPNPFNATTTIHFSLPSRQRVILTVYNVLGQVVQTLADQSFEAGTHTLHWDAAQFTAGVYFYRMEAGEFCVVKKLLLVK